MASKKKKGFTEPKIIEIIQRKLDNKFAVWAKLRITDYNIWSWYSGRWVCVGVAKTKSLARKKAQEFDWDTLEIKQLVLNHGWVRRCPAMYGIATHCVAQHSTALLCKESIMEEPRIFVSVNMDYMLITIDGVPYKKKLKDDFLVFINQQIAESMRERNRVNAKNNI